MNYLAHAYLSLNQRDILTGNMISDFVKGKKQYDYPLMIQKGIRLHRLIDAFTDAHPATGEIKKYFKPDYRLYAGAFTDIVYDYFLANDPNEFSSVNDLEAFTLLTYEELETNASYFPEQFLYMFPYMKMQNWLYNYLYESGIEKSFSGMARRAKYIPETGKAFSIFRDNTPSMKIYYDDFFPLLKQYTVYTLEQLLNAD